MKCQMIVFCHFLYQKKMILFVFFSFSFSFLQKFVGQWDVYERYPSSPLYTISIVENEEISNRFESTIFKNYKYDNANPLSLDDAFIAEFFIDIDSSDNHKGFAFNELPENKIFDFSYSSEKQVIKIEKTADNIIYTVYLNPNDPNNERIKTLYKTKNPILLCQSTNATNSKVLRNLYVQKVEEPSTFDLINYLGIISIASVVIILFQTYNFFKNWKKEQEKYSQKMKQRMLKEMAEKQKLEQSNENRDTEEENEDSDDEGIIYDKHDDNKIIRRKLIQEKLREKADYTAIEKEDQANSKEKLD